MKTTLILILLGLCPMALSSQAPLNVPSTAFPTIQSAILAVLPGGTVQVAAGTYPERLVFPAKTFRLKGAGPGLTIIDANLTGACMTFRNGPVTSAMVIDGFSMMNGIGAFTTVGFSQVRAGGGVFIRNTYPVSPPISPTFKNCEIYNNRAEFAGGVYVQFGGDVSFENCHIHSNTVSTTTSPVSVAIHAQSGQTNLSFLDCIIENHSSLTANALVWIDGATASFRGCAFSNNVIAYGTCGISGSSGGGQLLDLEVVDCSFMGSQTNIPGASVLWFGSANNVVLEGCLFANNSGGRLMVGFGGGTRSIRNCTFVDNQLGNNAIAGPPLGMVTFGSTVGAATDVLQIENSIFLDNTFSDGSVVENIYTVGATVVVYRNSIVETSANSSTLLRPSFIDSANANYRLAPMSAGVNGGTTTLVPPAPNIASTFDLDGKPRVQFSAIDMGCYEAGHISYHDSANGRVGMNAGGPYDVLQVNGSSGDVLRTVAVPMGTSSNVSMIQPPNMVSPAGFAIFGLIGEATASSVTTVPLGIGDMTFPPCPVLPWHPALFTLTNNIASFCPQLVTSNPASWTSWPFPPIFFPLTLTFQGVIEETPGVYVPTNMVIFQVN